MRLIDADELIEFIENRYEITWDSGTYEGGIKDACSDMLEKIDNMETIKPETSCSEFPNSWIPCSERLPEEKDAGILKKLGIEKRSDYVIATIEVKGERMTVAACTYDGAWHWNMKYAFPDFKVVAWMPLPEPYPED